MGGVQKGSQREQQVLRAGGGNKFSGAARQSVASVAENTLEQLAACRELQRHMLGLANAHYALPLV